MMYVELPFLDRFEAAAQDGFKAVEYLFPYAYAAPELAARLKANNLQQVLFNAPPGGTDTASSAKAWDVDGSRGTACIPGREAEFKAGVALALTYADALHCPRIHLMAGLIPDCLGREDVQATYVRNLRWAAAEAAKAGLDVLIEPINTRDIPRFFLNRQDHAHEIIGLVGAPNLKVQMDLYHVQIVEGDLTEKIRRWLPQVGHIQIAGVPDRHEPDIGEVNYAWIFKLLDELNYGGWIGCEYRPAESTQGGLSWLYRLLDRRKAPATTPGDD